MKNFNLGIIGCGAVVEIIHLPALERIPEINVKGLVDINMNRTQELKNKFGLINADTFKDYKELLRSDEIDMVLIATPPKTHSKIIIDSLESNKHIYCEKPLATSIQEIDRIKQTLNKCDQEIKLMVGYNFRFQPHYIKIKDLLNKNYVGKIISSNIHFLSNITNWPTISKFQFSPGEGGVIFDTGIHCIDLSRWLLGEVVKVYSHMGTYSLDIQVEDTATLFLKHENDINSIIHLSWFAPSIHSIMVVGNEGCLTTTMDLDHIKASKTDLIKNKWYLISLRSFPPLSSYQQAYTHFIDCVKNNRNILASVDQSRRNMEIMFAAYESFKNNKWQNV